MLLSVPFFRQNTWHTCGPACLKMLFAFHNHRISEDAIARQAHTSQKTGTARRALLRAARLHGFTCTMSSNALWRDVVTNLRRGNPVLINYREPSEDVGHYALVIGMHGRDVLLHDPHNGRKFRIPLRELKRRWLGHRTDRKDRGWMMTATPHA